MKTNLPLATLPASLCLGLAALVSGQSASENATTEALIYGYPLLAYQRLASTLVGVIGANKFQHSRELATAVNRTVVRTNVDTIYSILSYDISEEDLVITVPEIPSSQYHLFSYFDPFGDNYANANTGDGNINGAGKYIIRPRGGKNLGISPGSISRNDTDVKAYVDSPSLYGTILIRWLGRNASNYDEIHAWQDQIEVTTLSRPAVIRHNRKLAELLSPLNQDTPAEAALGLLANFAQSCPPEVMSDKPMIDEFISHAGINASNMTYTTPSSVNLDAANATAVKTIVSATDLPENITPLNNGWLMVPTDKTGDFRDDYTLRAGVASFGYLMLKAPNAIYPNWINSTAENPKPEVSIGPNEAILYTFSRKPPLNDTGFWSVTAYTDNYLIPNKQNVYALGDRSNLTYPNSQKVYGSSNSSIDGPFQILVQPSDVIPPANWTNNWLPAPAGGGSVLAQLRLFEVESDLLDGTYEYPVVTRIAALTEGGGSPPPYTGAAERLSSVWSAFTAVGALGLVVWMS